MHLYSILYETYKVLTITLAVFIILELLFPGMVLAYINVNWLLILWLINAMVVLAGKE